MSSALALDTFELTVPQPRDRSRSYVARIPMTDEQFLAWDHGNRLAEWVDGEAFIYMTTTSEHERILQFLNFLIEGFGRVTGAGIVRRGPAAMRTSRGGSIREPDLVFIRTEHLDRISEQAVEGPADIAVEVISPDSVTRDRERKFREYEAAGIPEYWLIDPRPRRRTATFYVLRAADAPGEAARYRASELIDGAFHSVALPRFWLRPAWLWDNDVNVFRCLAEMVGRERIMEALG